MTIHKAVRRRATWRHLLTLMALVAPFVVGSGSSQAGPTTADNHAQACRDVPRAPFVDVGDAGTHADGIDCLYWRDVVRGVEVDRFDGARHIRRDQMATFVANAVQATGAELPRPDHPPFPDIAGNAHRDAIERLAEAGIVQGRADGTYDPAARVPRGQMTAFLVRAHTYVTGIEVDDPDEPFDDVAGHPHERTINQAAHLGLASGRTATSFAPAEFTRRDQMATFISRLLDRYVADGELASGRGVYRGRIHPLAASTRALMAGTTMHPGCPVGYDDLRLLEVVHVDFDGRDRLGLLIVHRHVAGDLREVFRRIHDAGFPIARMRLIERYGGSDDASMRDNNSSAFNCRRITGGTSYSQHSYGWAVDLNPVQNPYVRNDTVEPPAGRDYLDRSDVRPGMIVRPGPVTDAFDGVGWDWGGDWRTLKDYQHFELPAARRP